VPEPKGKLVTPVAQTADGALKSLLCNSEGKLQVIVESSTDVKARIYPSSDQTIPSGSHTQILIDTVDFDPAGGFDSANNRYIVPTTGYYLLIGAVGYGSVVANKLIVAEVYKGGSYVLQYWGHTSSTSNIVVQVSGVVHLAKDDIIRLFAWHNFGSDATVFKGPVNTCLMLHLLSTG